MKKITLTILAVLMAGIAVAQTKAVSILGDSYSTYEDFVTPATNEVASVNQGERLATGCQ